MPGQDLCYWIGFNRVPGIGAARLQALLDYFGTLRTAWSAPAQDLRHAGLDRRSLANLLKAREELDLERELERLDELQVQVLTWDDEAYPRNLREVYNPPPVLYVRGRIDKRDEWEVGS